MKGRRVYPSEDGHLRLAAGDYGKDSRGEWHARPPTVDIDGLDKQVHPLSGSLRGHEVVEHEDGTITVSPSILISYPYGDPPRYVQWHGFLERGIWRQV